MSTPSPIVHHDPATLATVRRESRTSVHTPVLFTLAVLLVAVVVAGLFVLGQPPSLLTWAIGAGVIVVGVAVATAVNQLVFRLWMSKAGTPPPAPPAP